jgi:hypothetical protein
MTVPLVLVLIYGEFHQGPETLEAFLLPAALSEHSLLLLSRKRKMPIHPIESTTVFL